MATKKQAAAKAGEPTEDAATPTLDDLKAPGGLTRRKINRGSTRRIHRALGNFQDALKDFADELDRQIYVTDENGKRTDACDLVKGLRELGPEMSEQIAAITTPPIAADPETE